MIEKIIAGILLTSAAVYLVRVFAKPSEEIDGWEDRGSRKAHGKE